ncbi:short chain oxidoreductase [Colletotrichum sojae]|uniref:Short chain oxidoreductase n=1 Tax=Colletotrichum sojae TaxID=2175907 RepID=A0A8H6J7Q9_9PEZI|nr:short chain oxidoreductase [Colletotrichum sojae]
MASFLITGASRGFGLALVRELASRPSSDIGTSSDGRDVVVKLDVIDEASVKKVAAEVETKLSGKGLDVLINNAGICQYAGGGVKSMENLQESLDVNVFGVHRVTRAFLSLLQQGKLKKVANISTTFGSMAIMPHVHFMPALTVQYALDYGKEGFCFMALCPGWLKTDLGGGDLADLTPDEGAKASLDVIYKPNEETNGQMPKVFFKGWEDAKGPNVEETSASPLVFNAFADANNSPANCQTNCLGRGRRLAALYLDACFCSLREFDQNNIEYSGGIDEGNCPSACPGLAVARCSGYTDSGYGYNLYILPDPPSTTATTTSSSSSSSSSSISSSSSSSSPSSTSSSTVSSTDSSTSPSTSSTVPTPSSTSNPISSSSLSTDTGSSASSTPSTSSTGTATSTSSLGGHDRDKHIILRYNLSNEQHRLAVNLQQRIVSGVYSTGSPAASSGQTSTPLSASLSVSSPGSTAPSPTIISPSSPTTLTLTTAATESFSDLFYLSVVVANPAPVPSA